MADIVSSDGHCSIRLHADWASVLVWTDLAGPVTIYRDGVAVVTLPSYRQIWYDHYPPVDVPAIYHVSNASTTSTTAEIMVPADEGHRTWLKSADNPNLSTLITQAPFEDIEWNPRVAAFNVIGVDDPFVIFGPAGRRRTQVKLNAYTRAERDALLALFTSRSAVFYQPCVDAEEPSMWAAVTGVTQNFVAANSPTDATIFHYWRVTATLLEMGQPATAQLGNIIPGWSWDAVRDTWADWDAIAAAKTSWVDLVKHGVW